ncbi:MAG TPA: sulfatase-like hydrolase/transferase [Pirellulales bacterium]|nr:sulfatase-like hydrolase/transferase [Pirellulales bacterium]
MPNSDRSALAAEPAPNIVFILCDDLGWADVGFHGGNAPTPQVDRLARDGVELAQHYVAPVCSPTRSSLLSGRYWSRFNVTSPQSDRAYPWETVTLPAALKTVGYETCITGKWHLGSLPEWGPRKFGFDHSYGSLGGGVGPWNHRYKQGPYTLTWHRDDQRIEEQGHVTDLIADEATQWIASRSGKPFFLYVPFTAVHLPIREPQAWVERVPASITGEVPRQYAACVMHMDDAVGRILAALDKAGVRDNTLVIFSSDNGGSTVENNDTKYPADDYPSGKLTGNNLPLRGEKGTAYEGGTRVPTIANWPAKLKPGKVASPVHIADWMPTLTKLAGYVASEDLKWDGIDIWPQIAEGGKAPERTLYGVAPGRRASILRRGDWKLIVNRDRTLGDELFDLASDPYEKQNLAEREPQRVVELKELLSQVAARDGDAAVPKNAAKE